MVNSTGFYRPGMKTFAQKVFILTTFAHKVFILTTFVTQSFDLKMIYFLKVYFWILLLRRGKKAPEGPPSPLQDIEGGARSAPNF